MESLGSANGTAPEDRYPSFCYEEWMMELDCKPSVDSKHIKPVVVAAAFGGASRSDASYPPATVRNTFTFEDAKEALRKWKPTPPRYQIDYWAKTNSVMGLIGDEGVGKTLNGRELATATASGGKWLTQQIVRPGNVLLVQFEEDREDILRHLHALGYNDDAPHTIYFYTGEPPRRALVSLEAHIREHKIVTAIVEQATDLFPDVNETNENSYNAMRRRMADVGLVAKRTDCLIVVGFHLRKEKGKHTRNSIINSKAFSAALDVTWIIDGEPSDDHRTFENMKKLRGVLGWRAPEPLRLELDDRGCTRVAGAAPPTPSKAKIRNEVIDVLRSYGGHGATRGQVRVLVGKRKKLVNDTITALIDEGIAVELEKNKICLVQCLSSGGGPVEAVPVPGTASLKEREGNPEPGTGVVEVVETESENGQKMAGSRGSRGNQWEPGTGTSKGRARKPKPQDDPEIKEIHQKLLASVKASASEKQKNENQQEEKGK